MRDNHRYGQGSWDAARGPTMKDLGHKINGSLIKLSTDHCLFLRGKPTDALCVVCLCVGQMKLEGRCLYCVACRGPWYCSTTCQRYHWSTEHRDTCVGYAAANFVKQLKLPDHCAALILRFARQRDAPSASSILTSTGANNE